MRAKKTNYTFQIPNTLKGQSIQVVFSYLTLRNLIYCTTKGTRTYTKSNKDIISNLVKQLIANYFSCCKDNGVLTENEIATIYDTINKPNMAVINKSDYILGTERLLGFQTFAFYCDVMTEISFHISNENFGEEYIMEIINEFCNKSMINADEDLKQFILVDTLLLIEQIKELCLQ